MTSPNHLPPQAEQSANPELSLSDQMQAEVDRIDQGYVPTVGDENTPGDFERYAELRSRLEYYPYPPSAQQDTSMGFDKNGSGTVTAEVLSRFDTYANPKTWIIKPESQATFVQIATMQSEADFKAAPQEVRSRVEAMTNGPVTDESLRHVSKFAFDRLSLSSDVQAKYGEPQAAGEAAKQPDATQEPAKQTDNKDTTATGKAGGSADPEWRPSPFPRNKDRRNSTSRGTSAGEGKRQRQEARAAAAADPASQESQPGDDAAQAAAEAAAAAKKDTSDSDAKQAAATSGAEKNAPKNADNRKANRGSRGGKSGEAKDTTPGNDTKDGTKSAKQPKGDKDPNKDKAKAPKATKGDKDPAKRERRKTPGRNPERRVGVLQDDVREKLILYRNDRTIALHPAVLRRRQTIAAQAAEAAADNADTDEQNTGSDNADGSAQQSEKIRPMNKRQRLEARAAAAAAEQAAAEAEQDNEHEDQEHESRMARWRRIGRTAVWRAREEVHTRVKGEADANQVGDEQDRLERSKMRRAVAAVGAVALAGVGSYLAHRYGITTGGAGNSLADAAPSIPQGHGASSLLDAQPSGAGAGHADVLANSPSGLDLSKPARGGERLWTYLQEAGVPKRDIMDKIQDAADQYSKATGHNVTWHGSDGHRWLEIVDGNGTSVSDTQGIIDRFKPYL